MTRFSRRQLATYATAELLRGNRAVIDELAAYLVESRRVREAQLLVQDIERELQAEGVVVARVTSAHALDSDTKTSIEALLAKKFHASHVELTSRVDAGLLGGVSIRMAGDEFDGTLRSRLNQLKKYEVSA